MHDRQFAHRDLAARNFIFNGGRIKITDFGLTRRLTDTDYDYVPSLYVAERTDLPILWMAPESLLRREYVLNTDMYKNKLKPYCLKYSVSYLSTVGPLALFSMKSSRSAKGHTQENVTFSASSNWQCS